MGYFENFQKRMSLGGNSLREKRIYNSRILVNQTFCEDLSYVPDVYKWELGLTSYEDRKPVDIRLYDRKFSNANGETVKFETMYDTPITVGDILYDLNANIYYLCTESFDIDTVCNQGKLTKCNWILKWQNDKGEILEYPCYDINSTQYNSGEQSNKIYTIGSSQHMLKLPADENTITLSSPQRFYLDRNMNKPTSYIVTQNDTTSFNYGTKGIVVVTVIESPNDSATDRPDLGICDYKDIGIINDNNTSEDINTDNNTNTDGSDIETDISIMPKIVYKNTYIKSGGSSQTFSGEFYDTNGNKLDLQPNWKIVCDFADKLTTKEVDNQIKISIDNDDYIDESFKLILSDNDNHSTDLIVTITSLL